MATTVARIGFGALLKRGDGGSPEVFTTVAEAVDIGQVVTRLSTVDATHMESPNAHVEKIAALLESGEVSVSFNYLPGDAQQTLLRTDSNTRVLRNWQITVPGSTKVVSFAAFVTQVGPSFPHDNKMMQDVVLTPSGMITIA